MKLQGNKVLKKIALKVNWWTFAICLLLIAPADAGQSGTYIPSLNAKVKELYFFESGYNYEGAPFGKRGYKTEFPKSSTRYVNWELYIEFPKPNRRIDFEIVAILYSPDGSKFEQTKDSYIESNWNNSYHARGWGDRNPGKFWSVGTYRVELYIAGNKVTSGTFEVVSDRDVYTLPEEPANRIYSPPEKPDKKIDTSEGLGEL